MTYHAGIQNWASTPMSEIDIHHVNIVGHGGAEHTVKEVPHAILRYLGWSFVYDDSRSGTSLVAKPISSLQNQIGKQKALIKKLEARIADLDGKLNKELDRESALRRDKKRAKNRSEYQQRRADSMSASTVASTEAQDRLEASFTQRVADLKSSHEAMIEQLHKTHKDSMESLEKSKEELKKAYDDRIKSLTAENERLQKQNDKLVEQSSTNTVMRNGYEFHMTPARPPAAASAYPQQETPQDYTRNFHLYPVPASPQTLRDMQENYQKRMRLAAETEGDLSAPTDG